MRKKLNSESGLTLVEMLCAVVILILLGLLLNTGLEMAVRSYRSLTALSEAELLLSTAVNAIADDLRYARNVTDEAGGVTYDSDSYGNGVRLDVDPADGQIKAYQGTAVDGKRVLKRVLSTGAYGAYVVDGMKVAILPKDPPAPTDEITFTIELTVKSKDGNVLAKTPVGGVAVRCLNPK